MKIPFLGFCMLMAGCCADPVVMYKPVTVEVPVVQACVHEDVAKPVWPLQAVRAEAPLFEKVKALIAENELRQGYEAKIEAIIMTCR